MAQVPTRINPQTSPTAQVGGYLQPAVPNVRMFAEQLGGLAGDIRENQLRREEFDLNKRVLEETNSVRELYDTETEASQADARGFTERFNSQLETRHRDIVAEYENQGYSREALQNFQLRLAQLRGGVFEQSLNFENRSYRVKVGQDVDSAAVSASQYATAQPDAYATALSEFKNQIELTPDLTEAEKITYFEQGKAVIRQGAGLGLVQQRPEEVIKLLDPRGLASITQQNITLGDGGEFDMASYLTITRGAESTGDDGAKATTSSAYGRYQFLKDTWVEYYKKVFGETGESREAILSKRADGNVQDQVMTAFTQENIQKLEDAGFGVNRSSVYLMHLLGPADALKVLGAPIDQPLSNYVSARSIAANKSLMSGKTVQQFLEIINSKMGAGYDEEGRRVEQPVETQFNVGESQQPNVVTGNPVLDDMTGPERMQLLNQARSVVAAKQAEVRASVQVTIENEITARSQGLEYAGPQLTEEQLVEALGPVAGKQQYAVLNGWRQVGPFISGIKTASAASIEAQLEALRPKDTSSPTYARDMQVYEAAVKARDANMQQRAADPALYVFRNYDNIRQQFANAKNSTDRKTAYAAMENAFKQLGIPKSQWLPVPQSEVSGIAQKYDAMGPDQKLAQLETWWNELSDTDLYVPFMRQMNGHDGEGPGYDNFIRYNLRDHPDYRSIMLQVLKGKQAIKEDPARRIAPDTVNRAYRLQLGQAISELNPTSSRIYNETAAALYVARGGQADRGVPTDPPLYLDSLRVAFGGVAGNSQTGFAKLHGGNNPATILPPAVTTQQWNSWLSRLSPGDLTRLTESRSPPVNKYGKPVALQDIIDQGVFVMLAPNQYSIMFPTDGGYLKTATGQPYVVNITTKTVKGTRR